MRQALRQLGASLLFAALSFFLIVGGLITALAEQQINQPPTPTLTETSVPTSVPQMDIILDTPAAPNLLPSPSFTPSLAPPTATFIPSTSCPAPAGWASYLVQPGDTLDALALRYGTSTAALQENNCLVTSALMPETRLYVPPFPTSTPVPCGPPSGWVLYQIQPGDNLYRISLKYRVTISELQQANCLGYSTQITAGKTLRVPNVPTSTPNVTSTSPATATLTFTPTTTKIPATATATAETPTETFPALPDETQTGTPQVTDTAQPE